MLFRSSSFAGAEHADSGIPSESQPKDFISGQFNIFWPLVG